LDCDNDTIRCADQGNAKALKGVRVALPSIQSAEVEDFVDFLRSRDQDRQLATTAAKTSEPAFAAIWDNDDDAEYDRL
jgi:hypothetical protein